MRAAREGSKVSTPTSSSSGRGVGQLAAVQSQQAQASPHPSPPFQLPPSQPASWLAIRPHTGRAPEGARHQLQSELLELCGQLAAGLGGRHVGLDGLHQRGRGQQKQLWQVRSGLAGWLATAVALSGSGRVPQCAVQHRGLHSRFPPAAGPHLRRETGDGGGGGGGARLQQAAAAGGGGGDGDVGGALLGHLSHDLIQLAVERL